MSNDCGVLLTYNLNLCIVVVINRLSIRVGYQSLSPHTAPISSLLDCRSASTDRMDFLSKILGRSASIASAEVSLVDTQTLDNTQRLTPALSPFPFNHSQPSTAVQVQGSPAAESKATTPLVEEAHNKST